MSIAFNGSTSKLQLNSGSLSISYPFTIFCWMKPNSATTSYMVAGVGQDGVSDNALFIFADGGGDTKVKAFARDNGSSAASSTTAQSTAWQPAMAVFTSSTSRTIYYASGAAVTDTAPIAPAFSSVNRITVGCRNNDTLHFNGEIEQFALWSAALTQANFDSLAAGALPNTVASGSLYDYWALLTSAATHTGTNGRVLTATSTTTGGTSPPVSGGDTTAPALTSPTGTGGLGVCSGTVSTNEGNGTLFAVAVASSTPLSIAAIEAGTGALRTVSQPVTTTGTQTIPSGAITGGAGTRFWQMFQRDTAGNNSAVVVSAGFEVTAAATSMTIALKQSDGTTAAASITGIHWKVLNTPTLGAATAILAGGTAESTDASGNLVLDITGLGLTPGDVRYVVAGKSNGTPGADFDGWQGPATAA
jgi:hypothetical protein